MRSFVVYNYIIAMGDWVCSGLNKISTFSVCAYRYSSECQSLGDVGSLLWRSFRLFIMSRISASTGSSWSMCRPVGMWCGAVLSRTVRKIFSYLGQSIGRERLHRAASTYCLYLSELSFFRLT